jgi:transforming growth factor-beta-induced protein
MKNLFAIRTLNLRSFALAGIVATALFVVSCSKENDEFIQEDALMEQESALKSKGAPAPGDAPIAAIAINAGFNELVAALSYVDAELDAGLVDLFLNGKDQYTVFAPTDDAFQALYDSFGEGVSGITDLPAPVVLKVLLYHVTEGRRAANSVVPKKNPREIETLLGQSFSVDSNGEITASANRAMILYPNISGSNGIIHVIDNVIIPYLD